MKRTLLDLTQNILSALNSDEVNSIGDTAESKQVAELIKTAYFNVIARTELPEHDQLFQLNAATDFDSPVLMLRPDNVAKIYWIKYFQTEADTPDNDAAFSHDLNLDLNSHASTTLPGPSYSYVTILPKQQFLDHVNRFNTQEPDVETFDFNQFTFNYRKDKRPEYCCVLQDYYIIFDSYNQEVDNTLQNSKTMCFGRTMPLFLMEDNFYPEIDADQVPLLLNEAKSLAFFELKQVAHPKAELEAKRQWANVQRDKTLVDKPTYFEQLPNFGRIPKTGGYGITTANRWIRET